MRFPRLASAAVLLGPVLGLLPTPVSAQTISKSYLAFGDSITAGVGDDGTRAAPGYPPRLQSLLTAAGVNATVKNFGVPGEKTPMGIERIDAVLATGKIGDVLILMEGTNNINRDISLETTIFDLDTMATHAEALGMGVIHATVIPRPPDAKVDGDNLLTEQLNGRIRNLAGVRGRREADPNEVFRNLPDLFAGFYSKDPDDHVGHPNAAGYDILARLFFNVIQGIDSVSPVPGVINPVNGATKVKPDATIQVDVWDFGTGIDLANTFLLVNGQPVPAVPQGTPLHATLLYQSPTALSGAVAVGLRSRDLATPPNAIDRVISRFTIQGANAFQGDINLDGRVDGADLIAFGLHFGSLRGDTHYNATADFNDDGRIDGLDLAILSSNFGQSKPAGT
ncbi:MAG: GDSL-type esterase/lipase family protein [Thermoanaerobaculia bacterium]